MARMTMTKAMKHYAPTFEETFERILSNGKAKGSSDKTLQTYHLSYFSVKFNSKFAADNPALAFCALMKGGRIAADAPA